MVKFHSEEAKTVRVESAVTEAIYTVLADAPVYLPTTAAMVKTKHRKGGCTATCKIINFPDIGDNSEWIMELDEVDKSFCSSDILESIRGVMHVLEQEQEL